MTIGFRTDRPEGLLRLRRLLATSWAEPCLADEVDLLYSYRVGGRRQNRRDFHLLYQGARVLARAKHWKELIPTLRLDVSSALGLNSPDFFSLLGSAVAHEDHGLMILGPLGSGRSTLAQSLCEQGAKPIDDPIVLLDRRRGWLQPIWSRTPACPVGALVITEYRPQGRFRPRRLAPGKAALELFARAPAASLQPASILLSLTRMVGQAPLFKGSRGEAPETAPSLIKLVSR